MFQMKQIPKKKLKWYLLIASTLIFYIYGGFLRLREEEFYEDFKYPYNVKLRNLVDQMMLGENDKPLYKYNFNVNSFVTHTCGSPVKLLFIVKSSLKNYRNRYIIRNGWGSSSNYEEVRTIFLVGATTSRAYVMLKRENEIFKDLVLGRFIDSFNNLTLKTIMGLQWAYKNCSKNVEFFMFVDDDYYVGTKNILNFIENPFAYPGTEPNVKNITNFNTDEFCLYSGFVFKNKRPSRKYFCKWFMSLKEYPYNQWPPYSTGGAYILSRKSLEMLHYASLITKPIRFADIFIGLLAYGLGIEPISNNEYFKMEAKYTFREYRHVLAAHGFSKPKDLWNVWKIQNLADKNMLYV